MTHEEFKQLTGIDTTDEQFDRINKFYMLNETIDKQAFCREYVNRGEEFLASLALEVAKYTKEALEGKKSQLRYMSEASLGLLSDDQARVDDAKDLLMHEAAEILGRGKMTILLMRAGTLHKLQALQNWVESRLGGMN